MASVPLRFSACVLAMVLFSLLAFSQSARLQVTVTDENGVAVPNARVILQLPGTGFVLRRETDFAGRCHFDDLPPRAYRLLATKEGFYQLSQTVQVTGPSTLDIAITHQQEVKEEINVVESPPAIDPEKIEDSQSITGVDVQNIPYPVTRDYRNVLPFIPGVVADGNGQPHIAGGQTYDSLTTLDGFDITDPVDGQLHLRVSTDAIRSIDAQASRYSAQYGRASAGVLNMTTGIGDNHYRLSGTNFLPSAKMVHGLTFDKWTPRTTVSGPIRKNKAWFYDALDGEYDQNIIRDLPRNGDAAPLWRFSNLVKLQTNVTQSNILTGSFLFNRFKYTHAGLSRFNPIPSTVSQDQTDYFSNFKDQHYFSGGALLEAGFGIFENEADENPLGTLPYVITPNGITGNYYRRSLGRSRRFQALSNLYLPPVSAFGKHQFKVGIDSEHISYHQFVNRRPTDIVRTDGTLGRRIVFPDSPAIFMKNNVQVGTYAQDRWSPAERLLVEPGFRIDWDEIVRRPLFSPRIAAAYVLDKNADTKISAGVGLFYAATNLALITRPLQGNRLDYTYNLEGTIPVGAPFVTSFVFGSQHLRAPRATNWSLGLERKLPGPVYLDVEYINRRSSDEFVYVPSGFGLTNTFSLTNARRSSYHSVQLTGKYTYRKSYPFLLSYSHSTARTNSVLDYTLDAFVNGAQGPGPLPWDSPNRWIGWGMFPIPSLPVVHKLDLPFSFDVHSGYPFSVVDQSQRIIGLNALRFPRFVSVNTYIEKRFRALKYNWALRAGFDNVTNRHNPSAVNSNISSPDFLTFSNFDRRTFVARIRFLGRHK